MLNTMMSESMMKAMKNYGEEIISKAIKICASKYNFDSDEAMRMIGCVEVGMKVKEKKEGKEKPVKPSLALPYNGEFSENLCHALRQNSGLYTQCQSTRTKGMYCNNCYKLALKSGSNIPEYGIIEERLDAYNANVEFVDPKGRKPVAYMKIMKKNKLTIEEVTIEAEKFGIKINPIHFEVPVEPKRGRPATTPKEPKEPKRSKGRPNKEKKVIQIAEDDSDLFASLVASANIDIEENEVVVPKKAGKTAEEKEAEKAEKEAKKLQEKAEKEAKLAGDKAEKEAKKLQEKAEKGVKKTIEKKNPEADKEPDVVKKITFENKKYLLSKKTGIVYDYDKYINSEEQVVVGKWNESDKKVEFTKSSDDGEESEEEYESESDEE